MKKLGAFIASVATVIVISTIGVAVQLSTNTYSISGLAFIASLFVAVAVYKKLSK